MLTPHNSTAMKAHEYRKIVKPLLERRRRARINQSLTELKSLLLETNPVLDNNEASRLEKADILELTVRHLKDLRVVRRRRPVDPAEYRAGFTECATEVAACVTTLPGLEPEVRQRLIAHLTGRASPPPTQSQQVPPMPCTPPPSPHEATTPPPLDLTQAREQMGHYQYRYPVAPVPVPVKEESPWRPW